jgi:hypothetical protein
MSFQGKRLFIKDMAYYIFDNDREESQIPPSLGGGCEPGNPTKIPMSILRQFHFTFLIRHPRRSIPSYYRCCIPPLVECTGFTHFMPEEAGYEQLVRLFNFLVSTGVVDRKQITVVDADDMLDNPEGVIKQYCERTGIDYRPEMLSWTEEDKQHASDLFAKWNGFHDDAIGTDGLQARTHAQVCTKQQNPSDWAAFYGLVCESSSLTLYQAENLNSGV